jgi:hypothetical protein
MARATLRKNGMKMLTLRVEFVAAINWIAKAIQQYYAMRGWASRITADEALGLLRAELRENGEAFLHSENDDEWEAAAWTEARRLFPEMSGSK